MHREISVSYRLVRQNSPVGPQGSGPRPHRSRRTWVRLTGALGLAFLSPTLTGCTVWLHRHQETVSWQQESVLDERPVGSPEILITPHADGWGWTLTVHEQVEQTIARRGTKSWMGRPAYVAPGLSWAIAAVGCPALPFAVLGVAMNGGREPLPNGIKPTNSITERCLYPLIGLWPWPGEHLREGFESVVERARRERTWRPVGQGEVGIRFPLLHSSVRALRHRLISLP